MQLIPEMWYELDRVSAAYSFSSKATWELSDLTFIQGYMITKKPERMQSFYRAII